jgi:hypothetical protein
MESSSEERAQSSERLLLGSLFFLFLFSFLNLLFSGLRSGNCHLCLSV